MARVLHNFMRSAYQALPPQGRQVLTPFKNLYSSADLRRVINRTTADIEKLARGHAGEKLLVDCGFNSGFVLEKMLQSLPEFKAYGFEVNECAFSEAAQRLKERQPRILGLNFSAVSTHSGNAEFYEMGSQSGVCPMLGTSIIEGLDPDKERGPATSIPSTDFSKWLSDIHHKHSNGHQPLIAVKMDIEGAEYDVLDDLLETGGIECISYLCVEFHARRFPEDQKPEIVRREEALRETLSRREGLRVFEWV